MESLKVFTKDLNLEILDYVNENPGCTVKSIYTHLDIEQSVCSKHLSKLIKMGFIEAPRVAKHKECYINSEGFNKALDESLKTLLS